MIYLIFAILCGASIMLIFRLSVGKYTNRYALLCGNYITCIVVAFLFLEDKRIIIPTGSNGMLALKLGMVNGALYLAGIVLNHINKTCRQNY